MFNPTKAHEKYIAENEYRLRMGGRVPKDAVNLAYSHTRPLRPHENVQITDTSGFILENLAAETREDVELLPDRSRLLRSLETDSPYIDSQSFLVTHIYKDNIPLYYIHRTQFPTVSERGPDVRGFYQGTSIHLVDGDGRDLRADYKYEIMLESTDYPNIYDVLVFTSFQSQPGDDIRVIYTAAQEYKSVDENWITPGYQELFNPQPAFESEESLSEVINTKSNMPLFYRANAEELGESKVYVSLRPEKEDYYRLPTRFRYRIQASTTGPDGNEILQNTPWIFDSVFAADSIIPEDAYHNDHKRIGKKNVRDIVQSLLTEEEFAPFNQAGQLVRFRVMHDNKDVHIYTQTDGQNYILASTGMKTGYVPLPHKYRIEDRDEDWPFYVIGVWHNKKTGKTRRAFRFHAHVKTSDGDKVLQVLDANFLAATYPTDYVAADYELLIQLDSRFAPVNLRVVGTDGKNYIKLDSTMDGVVSGTDATTKGIRIITNTDFPQVYFTPIFSVKMNDSHQIKTRPPREKFVEENWYIRVKNGKFERQTTTETGLPITYRYGVPEYFKQDFDKTFGMPYKKVTGERAEIIDERKIQVRYKPLYVRDLPGTNQININVTINGLPIDPTQWSIGRGVIYLSGLVKEHDDVRVDYYYEEQDATYRGYWDEEKEHFFHLDLNPGPGHAFTYYDVLTDEIKDVPTFELINKTVYLYMRPNVHFSELTGDRQLVKGTYKTNTLFHTFQELEESNEAILLSRIQVRPNASIEGIRVTDSRKRGGGLKDLITLDVIKKISASSMDYWDIGYWDGEPFPENGVMVARLPRSIYRENGGNFSAEEVQVLLERHQAFGTLFISEGVYGVDEFLPKFEPDEDGPDPVEPEPEPEPDGRYDPWYAMGSGTPGWKSTNYPYISEPNTKWISEHVPTREMLETPNGELVVSKLTGLFILDSDTGQTILEIDAYGVGAYSRVGTDGVIYYADDSNHLYATTADGEQLWAFDFSTYGSGTISQNRSLELNEEKDHVYLSLRTGGVIAVNRTDGSFLWHATDFENERTSPGIVVLSDGTLIRSGRNEGTTRLDADTGEKLWHHIRGDETYLVASEGGQFIISVYNEDTDWYEFGTDYDIWAFDKDGEIWHKQGGDWARATAGADNTFIVDRYWYFDLYDDEENWIDWDEDVTYTRLDAKTGEIMWEVDAGTLWIPWAQRDWVVSGNGDLYFITYLPFDRRIRSALARINKDGELEYVHPIYEVDENGVNKGYLSGSRGQNMSITSKGDVIYYSAELGKTVCLSHDKNVTTPPFESGVTFEQPELTTRKEDFELQNWGTIYHDNQNTSRTLHESIDRPYLKWMSDTSIASTDAGFVENIDGSLYYTNSYYLYQVEEDLGIRMSEHFLYGKGTQSNDHRYDVPERPSAIDPKTGVIYFTNKNQVHAHYPNGKIKWGAYGVEVEELLGKETYMQDTPITVDENSNIYFGTLGGYRRSGLPGLSFLSFNSNGDLRWNLEEPFAGAYYERIKSILIDHAGDLIVVSRYKIIKINKDSGETIWTLDIGDHTYDSMITDNNLLLVCTDQPYGVDGDRNILVTMAVNPDGTIRWWKEQFAASRFIQGPDDTVYIRERLEWYQKGPANSIPRYAGKYYEEYYGHMTHRVDVNTGESIWEARVGHAEKYYDEPKVDDDLIPTGGHNTSDTMFADLEGNLYTDFHHPNDDGELVGGYISYDKDLNERWRIYIDEFPTNMGRAQMPIVTKNKDMIFKWPNRNRILALSQQPREIGSVKNLRYTTTPVRIGVLHRIPESEEAKIIQRTLIEMGYDARVYHSNQLHEPELKSCDILFPARYTTSNGDDAHYYTQNPHPYDQMKELTELGVPIIGGAFGTSPVGYSTSGYTSTERLTPYGFYQENDHPILDGVTITPATTEGEQDRVYFYTETGSFGGYNYINLSSGVKELVRRQFRTIFYATINLHMLGVLEKGDLNADGVPSPVDIVFMGFLLDPHIWNDNAKRLIKNSIEWILSRTDIEKGVDNDVILRWEDPQPIETPDGQKIVEWEKTRIVRKEGSFPQHINDGAVVVENMVHNQYKLNGFVDRTAESGKTYYYQAFTVSKDGVVTRDEASQFVIYTSEATDTLQPTKGFVANPYHIHLEILGETYTNNRSNHKETKTGDIVHSYGMGSSSGRRYGHAFGVGIDGRTWSTLSSILIRQTNKRGMTTWNPTSSGFAVARNDMTTDEEGNAYVVTGGPLTHLAHTNNYNVVFRFSSETKSARAYRGHTKDVLGVAVDDETNVYSTSVDGTIRKLAPDFQEQWVYDAGEIVGPVAVDMLGNVYAGGQSGQLYKLDNDGNLLWKKQQHRADITSIAINLANEVYIGQSNMKMRKLSTAGNVIWEEATPVIVNHIYLDIEGQLRVVGKTKLLTYNQSGALLSSKEYRGVLSYVTTEYGIPSARRNHWEEARTSVKLHWTDPIDIYEEEGILRTAWGGTRIVRKEGSYPQHENDGTVVVDSIVRDQYELTPYIDQNVTSGKTYYYAAFPYTTNGVFTRSDIMRTEATLYSEE